jgi:hypothetical protein
MQKIAGVTLTTHKESSTKMDAVWAPTTGGGGLKENKISKSITFQTQRTNTGDSMSWTNLSICIKNPTVMSRLAKENTNADPSS